MFPHWRINRIKDELNSDTDPILAENELRRTWVQVIGGLIVMGGMLVAWEEVKVSRENIGKTLMVAKAGNRSIRFSKAVEHLSKKETHLAGLYTLSTLSKDEPSEYLPVVLEILSYNLRTSEAEENDLKVFIQILKFSSPEAETVLNSFKVDLSGANLYEANLHETNLSRADLSEADLTYVNLTYANLRGAYLSEANLSGAYLGRAILDDADLSSHIGGSRDETGVLRIVLADEDIPTTTRDGVP